jgi:uncharacterized protein
LSGWFIGDGFARGRASDHYVEVKGLAEREVTADLALWPLRYVSTGDDLGAAQAQINRSTRQVLAFLTRHGIDTTSVSFRRSRFPTLSPTAFRERGQDRAT